MKSIIEQLAELKCLINDKDGLENLALLEEKDGVKAGLIHPVYFDSMELVPKGVYEVDSSLPVGAIKEWTNMEFEDPEGLLIDASYFKIWNQNPWRGSRQVQFNSSELVMTHEQKQELQKLLKLHCLERAKERGFPGIALKKHSLEYRLIAHHPPARDYPLGICGAVKPGYHEEIGWVEPPVFIYSLYGTANLLKKVKQ